MTVILTAPSLQTYVMSRAVMEQIVTQPEKKRVKNRVGYHGEFWAYGVTNAYNITMSRFPYFFTLPTVLKILKCFSRLSPTFEHNYAFKRSLKIVFVANGYF